MKSQIAKAKKLQRQLELTGVVQFLGPKSFEDFLDLYKKADVFVLPCIIEKNGRRDIIPNAGIPEIIDHGVEGILVPPENESAPAQAIMNLLDGQAQMKFLGQNARRKVEERFDITRNIKEYVRLFQKIYDCPGRGRVSNIGSLRE